MPTDDEFRRVAEDVRALARSLARDVRGAVDRSREDPGQGHHHHHDTVSAAGRAAREELRRASDALRQSARSRHHRGPGWSEPPGLGGHPRWDNWGRPRHGAATPSGAADQGRSETLDRGSDQAESGAVATIARRPRRVPAPPLRHRHDGSTLLGLLAVVFGLAWLAAGTHIIDASAEGVLAVAIMVLGGAMVITARTDWALSRRSWPVIAGGLLLAALLVSAASPSLATDFRHLQFGSRTITASTWSDLPATVQGGVGETVIDLSSLSSPLLAPRTLEVDGTVGKLVIQVPADLAVTLDAQLGVGAITVNDANVASGFRPSYDRPLHPNAAGAALTVRVRSALGALSVMDAPVQAVPTGKAVPDVPLLPVPPKPGLK